MSMDGPNREPRTVAEARRAVEQSRARMSDTLDTIEGRLVETRNEVRRRLGFLRVIHERAREHPWITLGAAAVAGLLLGGLGRDDDPEIIGLCRLTDGDRELLRSLRDLRADD